MKKKMGFIQKKKMEAKKKAAKNATSKKAPKMTRAQALAKARKKQKK